MNANWVQAIICFTFLAVIAAAGLLERRRIRRETLDRQIDAHVRRGLALLEAYLSDRAGFEDWLRQQREDRQ